MTEYRVYLLGRDNKIAGASWIVAEDLEGAIATVREEFDCRCEIWAGTIRLAVVG